jgi:exodeoxyribonuclease VII small subunit
MNESAKYQEMLAQVEKILAEISTQDIDLDEMIARVEKGYELIHAMKDRLDGAKNRIEELHQKYED